MITERSDRFCTAFTKENAATIQDMPSDYLWESISVRDAAVRRTMKENFYHGMPLELLRSLREAGWPVHVHVRRLWKIGETEEETGIRSGTDYGKGYSLWAL